MNGLLGTVVDSDSCSFTMIVNDFDSDSGQQPRAVCSVNVSPDFLPPSADLVGLASGSH